MPRFASLLAAASAIAALACSSALAGNPNSSSITLKVMTGSAPTSAVLFGSPVSFNVATTATNFPWVEVLCSNGSTLLFGQVQGFAHGAQPVYTLGPTQMWSGGSASCTATLFSTDSGKRKNLASTSFTVSPST
jgi:hypothetical protein